MGEEGAGGQSQGPSRIAGGADSNQMTGVGWRSTAVSRIARQPRPQARGLGRARPARGRAPDAGRREAPAAALLAGAADRGVAGRAGGARPAAGLDRAFGARGGGGAGHAQEGAGLHLRRAAKSNEAGKEGTRHQARAGDDFCIGCLNAWRLDSAPTLCAPYYNLVGMAELAANQQTHLENELAAAGARRGAE